MVTTGGKGVATHAGARLLCELADGLGLSQRPLGGDGADQDSAGGATTGVRCSSIWPWPLPTGPPPSLICGCWSDQPGLFGEVASVPTAWRTLEAVDAASLERIAAARATARAEAWAAGLDPGFYVIDLDATLVGAHSDKEGAAPNYKHGFGFHPLMAFLDATG